MLLSRDTVLTYSKQLRLKETNTNEYTINQELPEVLHMRSADAS